jgi:hypothetical protein
MPITNEKKIELGGVGRMGFNTRSRSRKIGTSLSVYFILFCLMRPTREEPLHSVRASPAVLSTQSCILQRDEENPTYAGLTQENGFGSA